MPNWCEGKLKIRGEREDIIRFLKTGIKSVDVFGDELEYSIKVGKLYNDTSPSVDLYKKENHYSYWVEGTRRGFIDFSYVEFYGSKEQIIIGDFKQAWDIQTEDLAIVSEKFNLDLKIYAFEYGMEFNRDIEIISGEIIRDDVIEFDNYRWDCINPMLGG